MGRQYYPCLADEWMGMQKGGRTDGGHVVSHPRAGTRAKVTGCCLQSSSRQFQSFLPFSFAEISPSPEEKKTWARHI